MIIAQKRRAVNQSSAYRRFFNWLVAAWRNDFTNADWTGDDYLTDYVDGTITVRCCFIAETPKAINISHTGDKRDAVWLPRSVIVDFVYDPLHPDSAPEDHWNHLVVMPLWLAASKAEELQRRKLRRKGKQDV